MTGWLILGGVLILVGLPGTVLALLYGRTDPAPVDPVVADRPGVDDQFGTWPELRVPDRGHDESTDPGHTRAVCATPTTDTDSPERTSCE